MKDIVYIIFDEDLSKYKDKLEHLLEGNFDIISLKQDNYGKSVDEKCIFLGNNSRRACEPEIESWKYNQFGCRIGWTQNKCVIFAQSDDLAFADYEEFNKYCKRLRLDYPDVTLPPENIISECRQKLFSENKEEIDIHHAQYSSLIYEFVNRFFEDFIKDSSTNNFGDKLNDKLNKAKENASKNMTLKQKMACHAIIHATSMANGVIGVIPVPVADTIPITAAQITMILALGNVFDNKLTKSDAQIILKAAAAPLAGRALVKGGLTLFPGIGWAINGAIAGVITKFLGWTIANDFAIKMKDRNI